MILTLLQQAPPKITWVKFEKPTFDLVGVVLSSLGLAGICAVVALGLGVLWGVGIIVHRRRHPPAWAEPNLHLLEARRP